MAFDFFARGWFRTASFRVDSHTTQAGRRVSVHDLPGLDLPIVEDLGRNGKRVRFSAYVIGEHREEDRDALLSACAQAGAGQLWHPYFGWLMATCEEVSYSDSREEGGFTKFELSFVESELLTVAKQGPSVKQAATDAQFKLGSTAESTMAGAVTGTGVPQQVIDATTQETSKVAKALAALGAAQAAADKASEFARNVSDLLGNAADLATKPVNLAAQLHDALDSIEDAAANAFGSLYAYQTIDLLRPDTRATQAEIDNASAVICGVRAFAAAGWARALLAAKFASYEDAIAARSKFEASIDDQMLTASDADFGALLDLRGTIGLAVPDPASNLPRLRTLTLPGTMPSLVLASKLYDDVSKSQDIVDRNDVRNPCFVPGGVLLSVLTNA